jgi:hypothetical protein
MRAVPAVASVASVAVAVVAAAACGRPPAMDAASAAELFTQVPVDTAPGLSGLAIDEAGALWTVAERATRAYRITLDAALRPTVEAFPVEGLPAGNDLEAIAVLGGGRFALGTEGRLDGVATVLVAEQRGGALVVAHEIRLSSAEVGLPLVENHGAEGVCGLGDTIVASIEETGEEGGRRWAPVVRIAGGAVSRTHRLWLTTATGKLSGLDCEPRPDGSIVTWAVERHFEVTKLLRFTLPPLGAGPADLTPDVLLDLGPVLRGQLNIEGVAHLPDGRLVAVVDNQWKTITGPSLLLVFRPGATAP